MEKRPPLSSFMQKQKEEASDDAVIEKLRGKKGDKGDPGKDAEPPSEEQLEALILPLIPDAIPGKDGKTPTQKELVSLIQPLIPKPIKGKDGVDGVTPSLEELEALILPLIPDVEIPELQPKDLIEKINKAKTVKIKRDRVEGFDEVESIARSANKNVQNFLSLGGSRSTAIKVSGILLGTGINTINFVGATGTKVGDGSEVNVTTSGGGSGQVNSVVAGTGITVDSTDPANPIVSATGGGTGTVTSVASADGSITVTNPTTTVDLTVVKAPKLSTARTIGTVTGDATSAGSAFDGSANNTNALTLATVNGNVGTFTNATVTVNAKGLVTAASNGAGGGSGITRTISTVSTTTAAAATAAIDYVYLCSGTFTITLPTTVGNTNLYTIKNIGAGVITVATTGGETIDGSSTASIPVQFTSYDFVAASGNWNVV